MHDSDERTDGASTPETTIGDERTAGTSRRKFLRAGAATGALALGVGATLDSASAAKVQETCSTSSRGDFGRIDVGGNWTVMDNQWSRPDNRQCVWLNDDGSFGWDFDASYGSNAGPNYPEAYIGTRPWGEDTGASGFPIRRGDVDDFTVELNATSTVGGGEYDFALEWWLSQSQPGGSTVTSSTTHEIMLLFDWGGGHISNHGGYTRRNAFSGSEGHSFDVVQEAGTGGVKGADFWIFALDSPSYNTTVDLSAIVDFMSQQGASENLWLSGVEMGNEYWENVSGKTTFSHLQTTINGQTHSAGSGGGREPTTTTPEPTTTTTEQAQAPSSPGSVWRTGITDTSVDLGWTSVSDADGYRVYVDGRQEAEVGSTSATVSGLSPNTQYRIGLSAYNGAGESGRATTTVTTNESSQSGGTPGRVTSGGSLPQDPDSDGLYEDVNGNGRQDIADAVDLFQNRQDVDPAYFDFNDSGSMEIGDAVEVFRENTG